MTRRDWAGLGLVAATLALLLLFRAAIVEPRAWGAACAAAAPPWPCLPRTALVWLQGRYLWGAAALALGAWAFMRGPFAACVAAVAAGAAAVANYNATWGMLGAALGAWSWIRRDFIPAPVLKGRRSPP